MRRAFTLAEIMIVFIVIGVLTAILLPSAFQITPDEGVLKFKKANTTLGNVIRELVYSDKYYAEGDLGKKADGTLVDETDNKRYFCETFSEIVTYKKKDCSDKVEASHDYIDLSTLTKDYTEAQYKVKTDEIDEWCKAAEKSVGAELVTSDGVIWFQASPGTTFGQQTKKDSADVRIFGDPNSKEEPYVKDYNGFDAAYKVVCFDVDELEDGIDSFGYGIRADGKMLPSTRTLEYIKKSIQKEN